MLSMKDIATVKTAVVICNNPSMKKEILCVPGSDYDLNKGIVRDENRLRWYDIVEKKALAILRNSGLAKQLQEKVTSVVFVIGMKMLLWAEFHGSLLGLSREYSLNFLRKSFFTSQGMIDNKRAAEELVKDDSLNISQKYKLACLYCFIDLIPVLFKKMTAVDKIDFYDAVKPKKINQPDIVKFWSYYLMGEIDKLKGERNLDQFRLEKAVRSGSKAAVEYCLENTKVRTKADAVLFAAVEAVRCRISVKPHTDSNRVFGKIYGNELWVPSDYYVEVLCFLFSKMGKDQEVELFKKEIEVIESERDHYKRVVWALLEGERVEKIHSEKSSILLEHLLNWPYQNYFMMKAKLMWEFLPESYYSTILLMICDKIEFRYAEDRSFDYRKILKEFWCQSPDRYKRHVFKNQNVTFRTSSENTRTVKTSVGLLIQLLNFKNFSYEDEEIIKLIITSATTEEKENILSAEEWTVKCVEWMSEEKWETLDRYLVYFFSSKEEESKFKREFCFRERVKNVCIKFTRHGNWKGAESFINWSSLPGNEIKELKKEIINSRYGFRSFMDQILFDKEVNSVEKFLRWYLSSEEEAKAFKKKFIFSNYGVSTCSHYVQVKQELATGLINFCLSSEEEVKELKMTVAYKDGGEICERLISDNYYRSDRRMDIFCGGKWEEVEKYLTWCFSSEEEIYDFKKNKLLKEYGEKIHFELIKCLQWEEAETFFAWLDLSLKEIKELKKRTLLDYEEAREMFRELVFSEDDEIIINYGSKQEAIELLLRWYLTDKEMVLEWKDEFLKNVCEDTEEENEVDLKIFDLMIGQRLRDLDDENEGVKRTAEKLPPNKRHCTLKCDTARKEHDE